MSQYSLFNAADYVQKAYDNLVRALDAYESDELASLKWQMLQAWLSLQQARMAVQTPPEDQQTLIDVSDPPF